MKYLPEKQHFCGKGGKRIRQVYLDLENTELLEIIKPLLGTTEVEQVSEVRVRQKADEQNTSFTLTAKSAGGEVREEYEVEINEQRFRELLKFGSMGEISKERFDCEIVEGVIAEVDVYHGKLEGLVTIEVEYDAESISQAEVEALIQNFAGKGEVVSEYQSYKNKNLAKAESLNEVYRAFDKEKIEKNTETKTERSRPQVKKIAITGGPCAGKSQVMEALKTEFGDKLHILGEVATQLLEIPYEQGGIGVPGKDVEWSPEWQSEFQRRVIEKQLEDETLLVQIASLSQEGSVLLCDRGILDGAAYTEGGRDNFLAQQRIGLAQCFELYDAVIHLNSLATDNPEMYEELKHTNPSRFEDGESARALDEAIAEAYCGHEALIRIPAQPSIEDKIAYCKQIIENIGGLIIEQNLEKTRTEHIHNTEIHNEIRQEKDLHKNS
ncbi:MAG: hypothetical protein BWY19_00659 [bacterium ADurb.Bin212]|nr:MAG: hypothetical protein BWY19_00659 [bacterium ADurb.Bin212]